MAYLESRPLAALTFLFFIVLDGLTNLLYQIYKVLIISSLGIIFILKGTCGLSSRDEIGLSGIWATSQ